MQLTLPVGIERQPDDVSCGPTCLQAVYGYWGRQEQLSEVIARIPELPGGGTVAAALACDARAQGFRTLLRSYDLEIFDPTWRHLAADVLRVKLQTQAAAKARPRLRLVTEHYLRYLGLGGRLEFGGPTAKLLRHYLNRGTPILTGLSSTYLYDCIRDRVSDQQDDDILGEPAGHFVVLCGYDRQARTIEIADPYAPNPASDDRHYQVCIDRVLSAMLLGVLTNDADFLIIEPERLHARSTGRH